MDLVEFLKILFGLQVRQICHIALRRDHEFINTVQEGSEETHSQVNHFSTVFVLSFLYSKFYKNMNS